MRAARLRASKFPKPVIWTFAPLFSSPAMIPLSSNRASIARPASALDILVRMASAAVSSALFTASPCEGLGQLKPLEFRLFRGVARENPHKTATIWGPTPQIRKIAGLSRPTPPPRGQGANPRVPDAKPQAGLRSPVASRRQADYLCL